MKSYINHTFNSFFIFTLSLGVSACSSSLQIGATSGISNKISIQHTHLANECIDAVSHAHPNGEKEHLHHYHSCEAGDINKYAHSHPSNSITGFTRHVHPNGDNEHTHLQKKNNI